MCQHEVHVRRVLKANKPMRLKHRDKEIIRIWDAGGWVEQRVVGRTDSEEEAYRLEAERIRAYGLEHLTNATFGHSHSRTRTRKDGELHERRANPGHQDV